MIAFKKYIFHFFVIVSLFFLFTNDVSAENYEYNITSYDINVVVNENNTLYITEKIGAYFNVHKHGIFRKIPLTNEVNRLDSVTSRNRSTISEIEVSDPYSLSTEDGYKIIKIGDSNSTLTGPKDYEIRYLYNLGKDSGKEYDELYFNLIGNEWDTSISNITFTITMPKEFDSSKLDFSSGVYGSVDSSKVIYDVQGNVINGSYQGILNSGEALTVRLELPEGYFVKAGTIFDFLNYIIYLVPVLFLVISIFLWYKYGRDEQVIETVEFYPPKGCNSLEIGFLYKGEAVNRDVVSLLIYLANLGYIKISECEGKSLFTTQKEFKITKLKEYEGNNINEKIFMDNLFPEKERSIFVSDEIIRDDEVLMSDLKYSFYRTVNEILYNINTKENKSKIFEKTVSGKKNFVLFMIIVSYCLINIPPLCNFGEPFLLIPAILFPVIGFSIMFGMFFGSPKTINVNGVPTDSPVASRLFGLIFGVMFGGFPWFFIVFPTLLSDLGIFVGYMVSLVCIIGMIFCRNYLTNRTAYGDEMLGKLRGFKNFLETAEKERLESMVLQDPSYFYHILPYTYVLGVSDIWVKKFEGMAIQPPSWYGSKSSFNVSTFGTFVNSAMSSAQRSMVSNPSSSSGGGGSSGGGSSGGGSGGGGGGSW